MNRLLLLCYCEVWELLLEERGLGVLVLWDMWEVLLFSWDLLFFYLNFDPFFYIEGDYWSFYTYC